jgi:hypothetical protein
MADNEINAEIILTNGEELPVCERVDELMNQVDPKHGDPAAWIPVHRDRDQDAAWINVAHIREIREPTQAPESVRETRLSPSQYRQLVDFVDESKHDGDIRLVDLPHLGTGYLEAELLDPEGAPTAKRILFPQSGFSSPSDPPPLASTGSGGRDDRAVDRRYPGVAGEAELALTRVRARDLVSRLQAGLSPARDLPHRWARATARSLRGPRRREGVGE